MNRRSFFAFFTAFLAVPLVKPPKPAFTVPPGTIISFAGTEPPPGWILCDGTSYYHGIRDPGHQHTLPNFIQKV
jgi:Phage Tail Collar Domain